MGKNAYIAGSHTYNINSHVVSYIGVQLLMGVKTYERQDTSHLFNL